MNRPPVLNLCALLLAVVAIAPTPAQAETVLTEATITTLRNRVRLKAKKSSIRRAKARDVLTPGDRLTTGRSSLAEFRFNDGTLARMGELALFRFVPQNRNFLLNQGTVLLLIPPGKGISRVVTPSIQAGIRGSALFVRHDSDTNTTIVGALTNSGIEVSDRETNQVQELKAGQMVVAVDGQIESLYDFDLETFYETSAIAEGILQGKAKLPKVLQEIQEGLAFQATLAGADSEGQTSKTVTNPDFVRLSANRPNSPSTANSVASTTLEGLIESEAASDSAATNGQAETESQTDAAPLPTTLSDAGSLELEDSGAFPGNAIGVVVEDDPSEVITKDDFGIGNDLGSGELAGDDVVGDDFAGGDNFAGDEGLANDDLTGGDNFAGDDFAGGGDDFVGDDLGGAGDDLGGEDLGGAGDDLGGAGDDLGGAGDDLGGEDLGDAGDDLGDAGDDFAGEDDLGDVGDLGDDDFAGEDDLSGVGDELNEGDDDLGDLGDDDFAGEDDLAGADDDLNEGDDLDDQGDLGDDANPLPPEQDNEVARDFPGRGNGVNDGFPGQNP